MIRIQAISVLLLVLLLQPNQAVTIEKGSIFLEPVTGDESQTFKVDIGSQLRQELNLTQSSRINIEAKITFSVDDFRPEFFSFRLRHPTFQNLTEPVLAAWDDSSNTFKAVLDIGDPKQIKHMSGNYKLEVIVSDDRLEKQIRQYIANCDINFRFSLEHPLASELSYVVPSLILTEPPVTRIDPPSIFTGFVVAVIVALFLVFLWGLSYQKVNLSLLPLSGMGLIWNLAFLGCLGLVLAMLVKFWVSWSFIETIQYFLLAFLPVALSANYALIHIRKE